MELSNLYDSDYFRAWDSDNRSAGGCGIILSDPDRFDRIMEAAENGAEGSTHAEIIQDWQDCLDSMDVIYKDEDEDYTTDIENGIIREEDKAILQNEIDACYSWHKANNSLDEEVG